MEIKAPNWNKKPDYTDPLPKSNDAGKIPPNDLITKNTKEQPHSKQPRPLNGEGIP